MLKSRLHDRIACNLTFITRTEVPHLRGNAVFFHERLFCVVELQGVVRRQTNIHATSEETWEGIPVVKQEQRVVAERGKGDSYLRQIVQILQHRSFAQIDSMIYVVCHKKGYCQMLYITCLTSMGA